MKNKLINNIFTALTILVVLIGIGFGIRKIVTSYALENDWYSDYTYKIDDVNKVITLTKYNGTTSNIVVPSVATIDNVDYNVIINGAVYMSNKNITSVEFETGVKSGTSLTNLFRDCTNLVEVDMSSLNTANALTMNSMFLNCSSLTNINLDNIDTSNVTNMSYMFNGCSSLSNLNLNSFDTSNVTNMSYMFNGCSSLSNLNLNSFDTSNVTSMRFMLSETKLKYVNVENFNTNKVNDFIQMFPSIIEKIKFGSDFKFNSPDTFGRGIWVKEENGTKHDAVDLVIDSKTKNIAGTYTKLTNTIEDMSVNFPVDYKIGKISRIDHFATTNSQNMEMVNNNYIILKNLSVPNSEDFKVDGQIEMIFDNVVVDRNENNYDLRITIDNIHIYDANYDEGFDKFGNTIFYINRFYSQYYPYVNGKLDTSTTIYKNSAIKYDVTISILNNEQLPVDGHFIFSAYDLDIPSYRDGNNDEKGFGEYSEGINLIEGYDMDTLVLHPNTFLKVKDKRIYGTKWGDQSSELTEFIIQASANKFKFAWTGDPCGTEFSSMYQPQLVDIIKQDMKGNNIPGAKFELYKNGSLIETWVSTTAPNRLLLSQGKYILKEVEVPLGYQKSNDIEFYVDINDKIYVDNKVVTNIIMKNNPRNYSYTINYYDKTNNTLLDTRYNQAEYNSKILGANHKLEFTNYIYDSMDKDELIIKDKDNVINIYYVKKRSGIIEKHIDEYSNVILEEDNYEGAIGDSYKTESKQFDGFKLIKTPDNVSGTITEDVIEVIYYYRKAFNITTIVDGKGGTIEGDEEVLQGFDSTENKIIITPESGYVIDNITINNEQIDVIDESGMILDYFINMQEDKEIIVKFKQVEIDVPITDSNSTIFIVAGIILVFGIVFTIFHKRIFDIILKKKK